MKRFTLISVILFLLANLIYSQDIINETGKAGKFIVRDAEQKQALVIEDGNVALTGELKIESMTEGTDTDAMVVWDREDKNLKVVPRVFSKQSPLSKSLITRSLNNDGDIFSGAKPNASVRDVAATVYGNPSAVIKGSLAIGDDSITYPSFGYNTLLFTENNLRIHFDDNSVGSFPANDWTIEVNASTSGGSNHFAILDASAGRTPFRIEAGAPNHSLYVEDYGRIGFGTSIPYVELHIVDGDSPTIRLDQDGSSGWSAQSWDICGNETNFFVRDVTNGSKLSFRIQPNTPSSTLCLRSTGNVGIGTWSPDYPLHVERTGANASVVVERTSGAINYMNAADTHGTFGTVNNFVARISQNGQVKIFLDKDSNGLYFGSAGNITTAGDADIDMVIDPNGKVGIGTTSPIGKLDVNGRIFQRGIQLHADYVFDDEYELETIQEHADFMWTNKHLPAIPKATVDENGKEIVEVGAHRQGIVEELEKAHIYISELEERLTKLEKLLPMKD